MKLTLEKQDVEKAIEEQAKDIHAVSYCCPIYQCCIRNGVNVRCVDSSYIWIYTDRKVASFSRRLSNSGDIVVQWPVTEWARLLDKCPLEFKILNYEPTKE